MLSFFKKIQLDRIYRHFEKGRSYLSDLRNLHNSVGILSPHKPAGECTGYLKDKSVILNETRTLGGKKNQEGDSKVMELQKEKLRLTLDHLQSVFLMLSVSSIASVGIFFIEILINILQIKLLS